MANSWLWQIGAYKVTFTPCDLAEGVYACRLERTDG